MEEKSKLDQDLDNFNLAAERRARTEIEKIRSEVDFLRAQTAKLAESVTNSGSAP